MHHAGFALWGILVGRAFKVLPHPPGSSAAGGESTLDPGVSCNHHTVCNVGRLQIHRKWVLDASIQHRLIVLRRLPELLHLTLRE